MTIRISLSTAMKPYMALGYRPMSIYWQRAPARLVLDILCAAQLRCISRVHPKPPKPDSHNLAICAIPPAACGAARAATQADLFKLEACSSKLCRSRSRGVPVSTIPSSRRRATFNAPAAARRCTPRSRRSRPRHADIPEAMVQPKAVAEMGTKS